ncbi:fgf [Cryptophlebia leucotreta granulovirus]|uniref:Fgf n=1 Tax=Cryptophlebia leucotreta granulosis virus TaxID=35254 RepID=Q7T5I0_GVCL|nr:fgf [Cryptophlebia leucotreta granulovirus]AAQ21708.1 fgf [Cryptophlebia leucotreta granulovirus]
MTQLSILLFLSSIIFVCCETFNPYKYIVDKEKIVPNYTISLKDGSVLYDSRTPNDYLKLTNKTYGLGYVIGLNDHINLHSEPKSIDVRSTTANFTFFFYLDNNNKYYIRDENCNFLCLNHCGKVFTSPVRLRHHCKFNLLWKENRLGIYMVNKNGDPSKILKFDREQNLLTALVNNTLNVDMLPTPFRVKYGPQEVGVRCTSLSKIPQKTLDTSKNKCVTDTILEYNYDPSTNNDMFVKKDDKKFYKLRLGDSFINGDGSLNGPNVIFHKNIIEPNVYLFRNVHNCKFLCQNTKCGMFMSDENTSDCKIRVEQSLLRDYFYIKFINSNYYLSYNTSENSMSFSHSTKSNIVFEETSYNEKLTCSNILSSVDKVSDKCNSNNLGNILTVNLPNMFLVLMLNYNRTMYNEN